MLNLLKRSSNIINKKIANNMMIYKMVDSFGIIFCIQYKGLEVWNRNIKAGINQLLSI